jgi:hypothetical protein
VNSLVLILAMASAASSIHVKTPAHSHPLSADDTPSRGRRSRGNQDAEPASRKAANYFTLKAQLEQDIDARGNREGSVRGLVKPEKRESPDINLNHQSSSTSLAAMWDRPVHSTSGSMAEYTHSPPRPSSHRTPEFYFTDEYSSSSVSSQVLGTRWHDYSDETIQTAIAKLGASESPPETSILSYHLALRTLSSAYHNLSRARAELEESRILLLEKEISRRARTEALLGELQPSEQDIARRVIQSIFTDDDESHHQVQRKQSFMVRHIS